MSEFDGRQACLFVFFFPTAYFKRSWGLQERNIYVMFCSAISLVKKKKDFNEIFNIIDAALQYQKEI